MQVEVHDLLERQGIWFGGLQAERTDVQPVHAMITKMKNLEWEKAGFLVPGSGLVPRIHVCSSPDEVDRYLKTFSGEVYASGGALFSRVKLPNRIEERAPGIPIPIYRDDGPIVEELWYVERVELEELMELANVLGFPSAQCAIDPQEAFEAAKALVLDLNEKKALTIGRIDANFLGFRLVAATDQLTEEEVSLVRGYNKRHFGAELSKSEELDQLRNWIKKRFFTLGGI